MNTKNQNEHGSIQIELDAAWEEYLAIKSVGDLFRDWAEKDAQLVQLLRVTFESGYVRGATHAYSVGYR